MTDTVLFAGGGTAGHVFPAIAVARALALRGDYTPVFVGTSDRLEARLVPEAGFELEVIDALPLPRQLSGGLVRLPFGLRRSVRQVRDLIERHQPVAVASFGGYVSFPVSRASWVAEVPLLLHEQNAVPGVANQLAARWADTVALTFPSSAPHFRSVANQVVTGNPVRSEILSLDVGEARARARERFDLHPSRPTLLVFGGSQGARALNRAVAAAAGRWRDAGMQVIHLTGDKLHAETLQWWRDEIGPDPANGPVLRVINFVDDMGLAYAAADAVVCRAGATTIAELTALGLPAVLVPYPAATKDHQMANARALEAVGGAIVVPESELAPEPLADAVVAWLRDDQARNDAAAAAAAFGRRDASTLVAAAIEAMATPSHALPGVVSDVRRSTGAALPEIDDEEFEKAFEVSSDSVDRQRQAMAAAMEANEAEEAAAAWRDLEAHMRAHDDGVDAGPEAGDEEQADA